MISEGHIILRDKIIKFLTAAWDNCGIASVLISFVLFSGYSYSFRFWKSYPCFTVSSLYSVFCRTLSCLWKNYDWKKRITMTLDLIKSPHKFSFFLLERGVMVNQTNRKLNKLLKWNTFQTHPSLSLFFKNGKVSRLQNK